MWRTMIKKLALQEIKLTNEMINNGSTGVAAHPEETLSVGDTITASSDIYGMYQGKSQLLFRDSNEYEVLGFTKFPSSDFTWVIVTCALGLKWAISFDSKYEGGAWLFSKIVETKEEQEEKFLADPQNRAFVDALLLSLYKLYRNGQFNSTTIKALVDSASSNVAQNFKHLPQEKEIKDLNSRLQYFLQVLIYKKYVEYAGDAVRMTQAGLDYLKSSGLVK